MSCSGDVHLILCDGCTLTANLGIAVNTDDSLTIYGQSKGTGRINATSAGKRYKYLYDETAAIGGNSEKHCGRVTINGGNIYADCGESRGAAIGGGYGGSATVVINGGNIEAVTANDGCAIGGGDCGGYVTINGGTVNATGGAGDYYSFSAGIGSYWRSESTRTHAYTAVICIAERSLTFFPAVLLPR